MSSQNSLHKIVIVGGGSAGISVAARLLNAGEKDVAVIDPAEVHYYQPLWTLVGGGRARAGQSGPCRGGGDASGRHLDQGSGDGDRSGRADRQPGLGGLGRL
jgi:glycine/D-amino acid oxidase-like deaminating enzyme